MLYWWLTICSPKQLLHSCEHVCCCTEISAHELHHSSDNVNERVCVYVYAFVNTQSTYNFFCVFFHQQTINNVVTFQFGWIFYLRFIAFLTLKFRTHRLFRFLLFQLSTTTTYSLLSVGKAPILPLISTLKFKIFRIENHWAEESFTNNFSYMKSFRRKYWTTTTTKEQVFL